MKKIIKNMFVNLLLLIAFIVAWNYEGLYVQAATGDTFTEGNFEFEELSNGTLKIISSSAQGDVVIPGTAKGKMVTVLEKKLFYGKMGITSVYIPSTIVAPGTFDYVFSYCYDLKEINVASDNPNLCSVDGVLYNKRKTTLYNYPVSKRGESFVTLPETNYLCCTSFASQRYLKNLYISNANCTWAGFTFYNTGNMKVNYAVGGRTESYANSFIESGKSHESDATCPTFVAYTNIPQVKTVIADAVVKLEHDTYEMTGSQIKPKVMSVTLKGKTLREGIDYKVAYAENVIIGNNRVSIIGIGEYEDYAEVTYFVECHHKKLEYTKYSNQYHKTTCSICNERISNFDKHTFGAEKLTGKEAYNEQLEKYNYEKVCSLCGYTSIRSEYKPKENANNGTTNNGTTNNGTTNNGTTNNGTTNNDYSANSEVKAFVSRLYTVALGRAYDNAGLNDWTSKLVEKTMTGAEVARGFFFSDEFKNKNLSDSDYVDTLYRTMFNREADAGGKAGWLAALANGMSREYVFRGFAEGAEFKNLCDSFGIKQGTVTLTQNRDKNQQLTAFVARNYTKALGRSAEEAGINDWTGRILGGKATPADVTAGFIFSAEFVGKNLSNEEFLRVLYQTYFDREPDAGGFNGWMEQLNNGATREYVVNTGFSCSAEFANLVKSFGL